MTATSPSQLAGEALWAAAISEDQSISRYDQPVYKALEAAFVATVQAEYRTTQEFAYAVRDRLAEYGPHESLQGTAGRGVASFVEDVRNDAKSDFSDEVAGAICTAIQDGLSPEDLRATFDAVIELQIAMSADEHRVRVMHP